MPIVISRETGQIVAPTEITQAQRDKLWGAIVRNYAEKHPEIFAEEERNNDE